MELQRARRRSDELGHEPLCDRIPRRVLGKSHSNARGRDVTADRTRVDAQRGRRLGERALQHVTQYERSEIRAAHRVPADEVAKTRPKETAAVHGVPDRGCDLAVELADPQERRHFSGRKPSRLLETRDETLHDDIVADHRARAFARYRTDRRERGGERPAEPIEVREPHDFDDRRISEQQTGDRPIALGDDDDRNGVLTSELDLDAHSERRNTRIGDENGGARDMGAVDLVHGTWIQMRGRDRIADAVREVGAPSRGFGDLGENLVKQLGTRGIVDPVQRPRDVGLADRDRSSFLRIIHGPLMMLGESSCARRIRRMPEQRVAEHLRRLPLFSRLPDGELAELAERVRTKTFRRGEMIFRKDDPGTHLYMVLEGGVKIALPGEFGQEALVAIMRPGEFFGELALFDRSPRSATATALEDTRAALLAGDDFLAYLESHPASFRVVLETLARTIRRLSDRVEDLIFLDVPSRVAKYLLDLVHSIGDGNGNEVNLTQDELAAFIGASRVSVNRVLGDLERREIISIRRRRIAIKDADRLAKEVRF
jgi:CRP/FNR family transcriptional regulator, cyclic AMP receptor protein